MPQFFLALGVYFVVESPLLGGKDWFIEVAVLRIFTV